MTYFKLVKKYTNEALKLNKEQEAIKLLVLELSGYDGASFLIHYHDEIDKDKEDLIVKAIREYLDLNHPIQHILGYSYFYGRRFIVDNRVLIPRPETEELVSYVLQTYDDVFESKKVDCVDIGTGSGAIAVTLAIEEPNMNVSASDISSDALDVAKQNALINQANITFYQGDMLAPFIKQNKKFDILVSNPPYICDDEYVQDIVKDNEPHLALFGGVDGLKFYDVILKDASKILNTPNIIAFEHSYSKKKEMLALAKKYFPNGKSEVIKDLNGLDRIMIIVNK